MKSELIDAIGKLTPQKLKRGKRYLLTDEEWDEVFAAKDRGISLSQVFPHVQKRGFKTLSSFLNVAAKVRQSRKPK